MTVKRSAIASYGRENVKNQQNHEYFLKLNYYIHNFSIRDFSGRDKSRIWRQECGWNVFGIYDYSNYSYHWIQFICSSFDKKSNPRKQTKHLFYYNDTLNTNGFYIRAWELIRVRELLFYNFNCTDKLCNRTNIISTKKEYRCLTNLCHQVNYKISGSTILNC